MKQVDALWRPLLGFINTEDIQQTAVDSDAVTTVVKKSNSYTADFTSAFDGESSHARENKCDIVLSHRIGKVEKLPQSLKHGNITYYLSKHLKMY